MHTAIDDLQRDIDEMFAAIRPHCLAGMSPSITTMTFSVVLQGCENLGAIRVQDIQAANHGTFESVQPSRFSPKAVSLVRKPVNLKLFPKGSLHITGCRSLTDVLECIKSTCQVLRTAYGLHIPGYRSVTLNMINVSATWPFGVRLSHFADLCRNAGGYAEQPEKPPSCIVRRSATALIYKSGKTILTGKSTACIAETFTFVSGLMHQIKEDAMNTVPAAIATDGLVLA
jgi:TATA-box binding protein (TBP) (component of TFIID and TFIIIB)